MDVGFSRKRLAMCNSPFFHESPVTYIGREVVGTLDTTEGIYPAVETRPSSGASEWNGSCHVPAPGGNAADVWGDFWINLMASVPFHCRRRVKKKKPDGTADGWRCRLFSWRNKGAADAGLILF